MVKEGIAPELIDITVVGGDYNCPHDLIDVTITGQKMKWPFTRRPHYAVEHGWCLLCMGEVIRRWKTARWYESEVAR